LVTDRHTVADRLPEPLARLSAIAAGGALGTLARYGVNRWLATPGFGFPWPTFVVNVVGSLLLGLVVTLVTERWSPTRYVRPFAAIGFCGGFTTFSTLMVEIAQRGQYGRAGLAALYLAVTLLAGVAAVVVGMTLARGAMGGPSEPIPDPDDLGSLSDGAGRP
jgi:fluoride exporter